MLHPMDIVLMFHQLVLPVKTVLSLARTSINEAREGRSLVLHHITGQLVLAIEQSGRGAAMKAALEDLGGLTTGRYGVDVGTDKGGRRWAVNGGAWRPFQEQPCLGLHPTCKQLQGYGL
jgi:hypothetical protein